MLRTSLLLLCAAACFAQAPADLFNKPPADVDQALRARITEFYQYHVDGKFRQADALVAEDTKDFYYAGNKPKYLSFEISRIEYSEEFTRAKATVVCEQYVLVPGFTDKPLKVPVPSYWKLVDGQWFWYVDPESLAQTPFGKMKAGAAPGGAGIKIPSAQEMRFIFNQVKADKKEVRLNAGQADQVIISNDAQGPMSIAILGTIPGVDVRLDRMNLNPGDKATLLFRAAADAKSGVLSVRVDQTNQVIPIQVTVP